MFIFSPIRVGITFYRPMRHCVTLKACSYSFHFIHFLKFRNACNFFIFFLFFHPFFTVISRSAWAYCKSLLHVEASILPNYSGIWCWTYKAHWPFFSLDFPDLKVTYTYDNTYYGLIMILNNLLRQNGCLFSGLLQKPRPGHPCMLIPYPQDRYSIHMWMWESLNWLKQTWSCMQCHACQTDKTSSPQGYHSQQHYKILHSCEITIKTGAGACVHSEIKCDIEQKSYSEVNWNET